MTSQTPVSLEEFFLDLYNGHSGVAEKITNEHRQQIHVTTELESKIADWLRDGKDVILTGSPGDGKTHLLRQITSIFENASAKPQIEQDASEKTADEVLSNWKIARNKGIPSLLAVNHAPLRQLARAAKNDSELGTLHKLIFPAGVDELAKSEVNSFVYYSNEQIVEFRNGQQEFSRDYELDANALMIINLSYRAILTDSEEFMIPLLEKLTAIASTMTCSENDLPPDCTRCPIQYNVNALRTEEVRQHLLAIFHLIAQRGHRATVRDLIAFLVYILTRGVRCNQLWQGERGCLDNDYYNLTQVAT